MQDPLVSFLKGFNKDRTPNKPVKRYGYLVEDSKDAKWDDYLKSRPDVAGMAVGQGANGDNRPDLAIAVNPYNPHMIDPIKRDALIKLEAARHFMGENKIQPNFPITPEMQAWRQKTFKKGVDPYADDDAAFRETLISRALVNDEIPPLPPEAMKQVKIISDELDKRDRPYQISRMFPSGK
jgi:hypothetical protein